MEHTVRSYAFDDPAKNQKRTLAFVLVVAIHAVFIWVLNSGLGKAIVEFVAPPVETEIVDEQPEDEEPPPPPPPDYAAAAAVRAAAGLRDRRAGADRPDDRDHHDQ